MELRIAFWGFGESQERPKMTPSWPFWSPLGLPGGVLGGSGRVLGPFWGPLEGGLKRRCQKDAICNRLGCDLGRPGTVLGPSWGRLGAVPGLSWAHLRPSSASLGGFMEPFGALLGPFRDHLGHLKQTKAIKAKYQKTSIRIAFLGPRDSQEGAKLGSSWLAKSSKNHLGNMSNHLETTVASKGRSRSQFEAI